MDIKRKHDGICAVSECTMTFNRFGVKKIIVFEADNANEIRFFSANWSKKVLQMNREEYMNLSNPNNT